MGIPAEQMARWTGGTWSRVPDVEITGVMQDTRLLEPGMLYVALPGERVDGHAFIGSAMQLGASGVLCEEGKAEEGVPCLEVAEPAEALKALASGYRRSLGGLMLGITGSAGKTTVKDMLAAMFAERGSTCATRGNWNNFIGLPLSILAMKPEDDFGIFELGMNAPGEIGALADILQPVAGVITSIGEAHLERLGSVEAIAHEKAALFRSLPEDGLAILDLDSPWVEGFRQDCVCRTVTCSLEGHADIQGSPVGETRTLVILDHRRQQRFEVTVPLPGDHMRRNVLQSVALTLELGLHPQEIQRGLDAFAPAPMRWEVSQVGCFRVINDAYNANPLSMRSAIRTFAEQEVPVEKWLVLGAMNELGDAEQGLHRKLGEFVDRYSFNGVVCVGPRAAWIADGASRHACYRVETPQEASVLLMDQAGAGAELLVKGSRSEKLEQVLDGISIPAGGANRL